MNVQMRAFVGATLAALAMTVTVSCGTAGKGVGVTGESAEAPSAVALTRSVSYDSAGITLTPPPLGSVAKASVSQALDACATGEAVCPNKSASPSAVFAIANSAATGDLQPDGSMVPTFKDRPVYVFTWTNQQCVRAGVPAGGSSAPTETCTYIVLSDAATGENIYSIVSPNP